MIICRFENGKETSLRHVVVDVMLLDKEKILMVKRAPHLSNGGKYGLIGGYVDRGETAVGAVRREVREETGYEISAIQLFRINDNPQRKNEDRQNIALVFLAKPGNKVGSSDSESTEVRWFQLDALPKDEEIAFDHKEQIELYIKYQKQKFPLPIFRLL